MWVQFKDRSLLPYTYIEHSLKSFLTKQALWLYLEQGFFPAVKGADQTKSSNYNMYVSFNGLFVMLSIPPNIYSIQ